MTQPGTLRQIGDDYYVEFEARGLKYQLKAGRDRQAARRLLTDTTTRLASGEMEALVRDVDLAVFWEDFLKNAAPRHTPLTQLRLQELITRFRGFLETMPVRRNRLSQMSPRVVEDYKRFLQQEYEAAGDAGPTLINGDLLLLREVFRYGISLGYIHDNPVYHIAFVPMKMLTPVILSASEQTRLLQSADDTCFEMAVFMLETGATLRETCRIRRSHVNLERVQVMHPDHNLSSREIPLNATARGIVAGCLASPSLTSSSGRLFQREGGAVWTSELWRPPWHRLCQRLSLRYARDERILRNTFLFRLLLRGVGAGRLYRLLGLPSLTDMLEYLPLVMDAKKQLGADNPHFCP